MLNKMEYENCDFCAANEPKLLYRVKEKLLYNCIEEKNLTLFDAKNVVWFIQIPDLLKNKVDE